MEKANFLANTAIDFLSNKHGVSSDIITQEVNKMSGKIFEQFVELVVLGIEVVA